MKTRPNHLRYLQVLSLMTPAERLAKAFELSAFSKQLFLHGLRTSLPDLTEGEFRRIALERLAKCHNRNY